MTLLEDIGNTASIKTQGEFSFYFSIEGTHVYPRSDAETLSLCIVWLKVLLISTYKGFRAKLRLFEFSKNFQTSAIQRKKRFQILVAQAQNLLRNDASTSFNLYNVLWGFTRLYFQKVSFQGEIGWIQKYSWTIANSDELTVAVSNCPATQICGKQPSKSYISMLYFLFQNSARAKIRYSFFWCKKAMHNALSRTFFLENLLLTSFRYRKGLVQQRRYETWK